MRRKKTLRNVSPACVFVYMRCCRGYTARKYPLRLTVFLLVDFLQIVVGLYRLEVFLDETEHELTTAVETGEDGG